VMFSRWQKFLIQGRLCHWNALPLETHYLRSHGLWMDRRFMSQRLDSLWETLWPNLSKSCLLLTSPLSLLKTEEFMHAWLPMRYHQLFTQIV
jgi:hypothetical protein